MTIHWVLSSAGSGKTAWVVKQARQDADGLHQSPRVVVPSKLLVGNIQRRLAWGGGAIGVWVGTLGDVVQEVLDHSGNYFLLLSETMQEKILQSLLVDLELEHYQAIQEKPGFVQECLGLIRELKSGGIAPAAFLTAASSFQGDLRVVELGRIYQAYQNVLQNEDWADLAGMTWLAAEALKRKPDIDIDWGSIYLDGFDDLSPIQVDFVVELSKRVRRMVITLTRSRDGIQRELVHKRFSRLYEMVNQQTSTDILDSVDTFQAQPERISAVKQLEPLFFESSPVKKIQVEKELEMFAVPDREAEVRTALRWIRNKIAAGEVDPNETAILMRNLEPYRSLVHRIAEEYELPVRIQSGLPLLTNPAVNAIWRLIQLARAGKEGLIWHEVLAVWKSPYFSWDCISSDPEGLYDRDLHLQETRQLDEVIRWGRVIQGFQQWEEAFTLLLKLLGSVSEQERNGDSRFEELPDQTQAARLWEKFKSFVRLLDKPDDIDYPSNYIGWILELIGDPAEEPTDSPGLGVLNTILNGSASLVERDWLAVARLVDWLKEFAAADQIVEGKPVPFDLFVRNLESGLRKISYQPLSGRSQEILCADCTEARGLPFKAVAILGLAEGEFPATIREDPLLRDADRVVLRDKHHLPIQLSTDSAEAEFFYEAALRTSCYLLLTRPRIAENGATWECSPYWEEIERLTDVTPQIMTTRSPVPLEIAASPAEYLEILAFQGNLDEEGRRKGNSLFNSEVDRISRAGKIIHLRTGGETGETANYEGELRSISELIGAEYPPTEIWSASRLENYQTCPFYFFIGNLLGLEQIEAPEEGLDGRQLGNIYHRILENLYQKVGREYQLNSLLEALPAAATEIFRQAPFEEGFRETAWWKQTQAEIVSNLRLSLAVIEGLAPEYRFHSAEHRFGIGHSRSSCLVVKVPGEGEYFLRGLIDRVDRSEQGKLRIIDYKTAGPGGFSNKSVREGIKLQLPLYALAAEQALGLGSVQEGFYFHLQAAQPSSFSMSKFRAGKKTGPRAAMEVAALQGWTAVKGIRCGEYTPHPPETGCPSYCPAGGFCWKYQPGYW